GGGRAGRVVPGGAGEGRTPRPIVPVRCRMSAARCAAAATPRLLITEAAACPRGNAVRRAADFTDRLNLKYPSPPMPPLSDDELDARLRAFLCEDVGSTDVTTEATVP